MDTFSASYLSGLTAALTTQVLNALGSRLKTSIYGTEKEQAVKRCLNAALVALVKTASTEVTTEINLLRDIFKSYFSDAEVGREVVQLLNGRNLVREEMHFLFGKAEFEAKTLPGVDFDAALSVFEYAFIIAAANEETLQGVIQTSQLLKQTKIQQDIRDDVRKLVELMQGMKEASVEIRGGEVSEIQQQKQLSSAAFRTTPSREAYLNRVFGASRKLNLAGVDPKVVSNRQESQLNLDAVYTALGTLTPEEHDKMLRAEISERKTGHQSALAQLNSHRKLVLMGDPGSGKSTFVNFVALCLAGEDLASQEANITLLTKPLPEEKSDEQPKSQPWRHGPLLPVRVILRDFAARGLPAKGQKTKAKHLWNFLQAELKADKLVDFAPYLQQELREKGGLLLIDGLDEVPEADQRRGQIKEAVESFAASFPKCRIVVTSRTYAYQKQDWKLTGFVEAILAPFSKGQILSFVEHWYAKGAAGSSQDDAKGRAELLKQAILNNPRLFGLAERPLLLTLMASLHAWRGGTLPEKREELYADSVDLLLYWWESPKAVHRADGTREIQQASLTEWLKVDRDRVRALLQQLAFNAHQAQPELVGTADIPEKELTSGLLALTENPEVKPKRLVEYLSDRAGLLLPRGVEVYTFPHRTFQEYLAACFLTDYNYPEKLVELFRDEPERWREVALLAGAKAARGSVSTIWTLIEELCLSTSTADELDVPDAWSAHLAGQALVEVIGMSKISQRDQIKVDTVKDRLTEIIRMQEFPAIERVSAGANLGRLGEPRKEVLTIQDMQFCLVPEGPFWMGSDESGDELQHLNQALDYDYWLSRYPVTNAQFNCFIAAGGNDEESFWTKAGWSWRQSNKRTGPDDYGRPFDLPNHPVGGVSWYEALAFTFWLDAQYKSMAVLPQDHRMQLPSEAEWEKAARGGVHVPRTQLVGAGTGLPAGQDVKTTKHKNEKRIYPWGNEPDSNRANYSETGVGATNAVGAFPAGSSPYGCEEMSGNVWEWMRSLWGKDLWKPDFKYAYKPGDGREDLNATKDIRRVLRGGSFDDFAGSMRCSYRYGYPPGRGGLNLGFRVVLSPFYSEL